MPRTTLIAGAILATVAASAGSAQVLGSTCRSRSLTDLANCIAHPTLMEEAATFDDLPGADAADAPEAPANSLQPSQLGGALQPSALRAGGPAAGAAVAPRRTNDVPVALAPTRAPLSAYGAGRNTLRQDALRSPMPTYGAGRNTLRQDSLRSPVLPSR